MPAPSTQWAETVGADEATRFEQYGQQLVDIQKRGHEKFGRGRALHRKQHVGLEATLEVLGDLPEHARHGLFAKPATYATQIRLSNGSGARAKDTRPDVRGFAIRVNGVDGDGALGGKTTAQCFVLINSATFTFPNVEQFMNVVVAAAKSPFSILRALQKQHGFFGGFKQARILGAGLGKPFAGFAREPFHSAAPIACGKYAAKVRLVPHNGDTPLQGDWVSDLVTRLAAGELRWDLQLQFFVDEKTTPIEDPTVLWPEADAPFVTVGKLVAPKQDPNSAAGKAVAEAVEKAAFDPWVALADHRPLGEIMRARKVAYFKSQQERG